MAREIKSLRVVALNGISAPKHFQSSFDSLKLCIGNAWSRRPNKPAGIFRGCMSC